MMALRRRRRGQVWVGTIGAGLVEIDTRSRVERRYGTASTAPPVARISATIA